MHKGCVALATTGADCTLAFFARALVQFHAKLCRSLKDMEEFPKWKVEQSRNHGDRVQNGNEIVEAATEPLLGNRQGQARNRYGEKHNQRPEIHGQRLNRARSFIPHPAPQGKRYSAQNQESCDIKTMEKNQSSERVQTKPSCRKPEQVGDIYHLIVRGAEIGRA